MRSGTPASKASTACLSHRSRLATADLARRASLTADRRASSSSVDSRCMRLEEALARPHVPKVAVRALALLPPFHARPRIEPQRGLLIGRGRAWIDHLTLHFLE